MNSTIPYDLPPKTDIETPETFRKLAEAHRFLAELKGGAGIIPNQNILISTLSLQEAESSSAIEEIVTTQDALYQYELFPDSVDPATKEAAHYADALRIGFERVKGSGCLTINTILEIQATLLGNTAGFRSLPGTALMNQRTGEVVFTPPSPELVPGLMDRLEKYLHDESRIDPLIRMAVAHHYFESVHPFYDGNGRTGRILNILFLVKEGLLDTPILYLSRYINRNRDLYYRLLREVQSTGAWETWIVYMLEGITDTARDTLSLVRGIHELLLEYKHEIRRQHRFYSQDLISSLFRHPYTKVSFIQRDLGVSRATAARYLDALAEDGYLSKEKKGRENYYVNRRLVGLLGGTSE